MIKSSQMKAFDLDGEPAAIREALRLLRNSA